jgi:hypothetical protein
MALKSKRPSSGAGPGGKTTTVSRTGKMRHASVTVTGDSSQRDRPVAVETIEARLERKATAADTTTFVTDSLGQMTRDRRHRLLYGD